MHPFARIPPTGCPRFKDFTPRLRARIELLFLFFLLSLAAIGLVGSLHGRALGMPVFLRIEWLGMLAFWYGRRVGTLVFFLQDKLRMLSSFRQVVELNGVTAGVGECPGRVVLHGCSELKPKDLLAVRRKARSQVCRQVRWGVMDLEVGSNPAAGGKEKTHRVAVPAVWTRKRRYKRVRWARQKIYATKQLARELCVWSRVKGTLDSYLFLLFVRIPEREI